jgi:hypothetical protein
LLVLREVKHLLLTGHELCQEGLIHLIEVLS